MRTIRWGMIGAGDVTEVKSGPGFQKAEHSALVAVMRRNGELARDYAERHHVPKWYDDADALINDPEVDAVYIATPPYAHKAYTLRCAEAGKPVYVEKPMALNFAECQAMVEACHAANVPLFVAYYRRMLPRFLKIRELIDSEAIGAVLTVNVRLYRPAEPFVDGNLPWRVIPEQSGGGIFVDMGSHMLDFLDYVLGPYRTVSGIAANRGGSYPAEDSVSACFEFESGYQGVGQWCFTSFQDFDLTEIVGTHGKLAFSTFDAAPFTLTTAQGVQQFDIPNPPHVQQPLIQSIVDQLNGQGGCPSTGDSAARTASVTDQILAAYYK
ncbi:MAG: Gfo/Idh/MocA family oxidoreductase [Chloroflexota bacterium]